jgi:hypothetical protein
VLTEGSVATGAAGALASGEDVVAALGALVSGGAAGGGDPPAAGMIGTPATGVRLGGGLGGAVLAIGVLFSSAIGDLGAAGSGAGVPLAAGGIVAERGRGEGRRDTAPDTPSLPVVGAALCGGGGLPSTVSARLGAAGGTAMTGMPSMVLPCWPGPGRPGGGGAEGAALVLARGAASAFRRA